MPRTVRPAGTLTFGSEPKAPFAVTDSDAAPEGAHVPAVPAPGVAHAVSDARSPMVTTSAGMARTDPLSGRCRTGTGEAYRSPSEGSDAADAASAAATLRAWAAA